MTLYGHGVWRAKQTAGVIVRHVDFHYFSHGKAPKRQGKVVQTVKGQIIEKKRYFLIVGRAGDRVVECPIFTYGGHGLHNRVKASHREYCSIRPLNTPAENSKNHNPERRVLDVVSMEQNEQLLAKSSVVRLSNVISRDHGVDVDVVGTISLEALNYAAQMVVDLMWETVTSESMVRV
jgi:hypothetical protein